VFGDSVTRRMIDKRPRFCEGRRCDTENVKTLLELVIFILYMYEHETDQKVMLSRSRKITRNAKSCPLFDAFHSFWQVINLNIILVSRVFTHLI